MTTKRNTSHFVKDWYKSDDCVHIIKDIYSMNNVSPIIRKKFNFLEFPDIGNIDILTYKLVLIGNEDVGKSSFSERLCGQNIKTNSPSFQGLTMNKVYIPFQLKNDRKIVLICFEIWDCNTKSMENYPYMKESLMENADGIVYLFSMSQQSSFNDLGTLISRTVDVNKKHMACQFIVATKVDLYGYLEVTRSEVKTFEDIWKIPIFFVSNLISNLDFECRHGKREHPPFCQEIELLMPLLERMADDLWNRQQLFINN